MLEAVCPDSEVESSEFLWFLVCVCLLSFVCACCDCSVSNVNVVGEGFFFLIRTVILLNRRRFLSPEDAKRDETLVKAPPASRRKATVPTFQQSRPLPP